MGAALRDVVAGHGADSWVRCEAPWELLAIWIPTVVFSQVPGKHGESRPVICSDISACRWVSEWMCESDSLAGVGLRYECVVMGILRVPALADEPGGYHVHCPPITLSSALVTLGCFHHITFRRCFCEIAEIY